METEKKTTPQLHATFMIGVNTLYMKVQGELYSCCTLSKVYLDLKKSESGQRVEVTEGHN